MASYSTAAALRAPSHRLALLFEAPLRAPVERQEALPARLGQLQVRSRLGCPCPLVVLQGQRPRRRAPGLQLLRGWMMGKRGEGPIPAQALSRRRRARGCWQQPALARALPPRALQKQSLQAVPRLATTWLRLPLRLSWLPLPRPWRPTMMQLH